MILRRLLVLILCLCVLGTSVAWSADDGSMSVQVKQSQVRTAPSFLARIIATLNYGDRVYIVSRQGTWSQIFLPSAAPAFRTIFFVVRADECTQPLTPADVNQTATSDELALAGKGFNKKVEGEYRNNNKDLNYARIDRMERMKVSPNAIRKFLREGAVSPQGGVQ